MTSATVQTQLDESRRLVAQMRHAVGQIAVCQPRRWWQRALGLRPRCHDAHLMDALAAHREAAAWERAARVNERTATQLAQQVDTWQHIAEGGNVSFKQMEAAYQEQTRAAAAAEIERDDARARVTNLTGDVEELTRRLEAEHDKVVILVREVDRHRARIARERDGKKKGRR